MVIAPPGAPTSFTASLPVAAQVPSSAGSAGAPSQVIAWTPPPVPDPPLPPEPELELVPDVPVALSPPPNAQSPTHITGTIQACRMGRSIGRLAERGYSGRTHVDRGSSLDP